MSLPQEASSLTPSDKMVAYLLTHMDKAGFPFEEGEELMLKNGPLTIVAVVRKIKPLEYVGYVEKEVSNVLSNMLRTGRVSISCELIGTINGISNLRLSIEAKKREFPFIYFRFLLAQRPIYLGWDQTTDELVRKDLNMCFDVIDGLVDYEWGMRPDGVPNDIRDRLSASQGEDLIRLCNMEISKLPPPFWVTKNGISLNLLTREIVNRELRPIGGGIYGALDSKTVMAALLALERRSNVESSTLIICLAKDVDNWQNEINSYLPETHINFCTSLGGEEIDLEPNGVVLTTYDIFEGASNFRIFQKEWFRVIVGEGHDFSSVSLNQQRELKELKAVKKWVLFENPEELVASNMKYLKELLVFLRIEPLSVSYWEKLIKEAVEEESWIGLWNMQILMSKICLKRTNCMMLSWLASGYSVHGR